MRWGRLIAIGVGMVCAAGCGEGGGGGATDAATEEPPDAAPEPELPDAAPPDAPGPAADEVIAVVVAPAEATIHLGCLTALTATATFGDGDLRDVTAMAVWTSANAAVVSVDDGGVATGAAPGGPIAITASYGGKAGSAGVTVGSWDEWLAIAPAEATIDAGRVQSFAARRQASTGLDVDVTDDPHITWTSEHPEVAQSIGSGLFDALAQGGSAIYASYQPPECPGLILEGEAQLTVGPPTPVSLFVAPPTLAMSVCTTAQFTAVVLLSDSTAQDVTELADWSTSNAAIATVDGGLVSALSPGGPIRIGATYKDESAETSVFVSGDVIVGIEIAPLAATIAVGETQAYTATATFVDFTTFDVTHDANLSWFSSHEEAATIGTGGVATGLSPMSTEIYAEYDRLCLGKLLSPSAVLTVVAASSR